MSPPPSHNSSLDYDTNYLKDLAELLPAQWKSIQ
jgi:hypothetical protein